MSTVPGPVALRGSRASACACSGCARRRVHPGLRRDHHLGARHLAAVHPRLALLGRGSCPEGQRGRSRPGLEKAGPCGGRQAAAARHLGASREHPNGLLGHPALLGDRSAGRGQHQNLAAGHQYPENRDVTSVRPARTGRFGEPSGDRREQAGDLARASPPAGRGHRPVRRARLPSERNCHLDQARGGALTLARLPVRVASRTARGGPRGRWDRFAGHRRQGAAEAGRRWDRLACHRRDGGTAALRTLRWPRPVPRRLAWPRLCWLRGTGRPRLRRSRRVGRATCR